jgi:prephenate dehydratase
MEMLEQESRQTASIIARRVGIAAEVGSFSDEAALSAFGQSCERVASRDARQTLRALAAGEIERAVLPIHHCVLAVAGTTLGDIHTIQSHPVALAQCRSFFERHPNIRPIASYDTARSAREVAESRDLGLAAIASVRAAERYGLAVLARDVEDRPDNSTRFLVMSMPADAPDVDGSARTMLLYATINEPGALLRTLEPLAARGMNLSKLESRPTGRLGAYRFVAEFDHDGGTAAAREAVREIAPFTLELRTIGTWARG